jgi:glycoprotein endo-alpha-1,2-mannosidase
MWWKAEERHIKPRNMLSIILLVATVVAAAETHLFYYLWYGNPQTDGKYLHWNHAVLPHWTPSINARFPQVGDTFSAPRDIHSPFYPVRGTYSSRDPETLQSHMEEAVSMEAPTLVVSWWGQAGKPGTHDTQGVHSDTAIPAVLAMAEKTGAQIAFHLEPYHGRSAVSVAEDVAYLIAKYGSSKAIKRMGLLPVFYVYDSYHIAPEEWARVLSPEGDRSLRNGVNDGIFIGLWLNAADGESLLQGHFDGAYTYFASEGFSYGSTVANWPSMGDTMRQAGKLFVASVGPGYNDEKIRPWNRHNTKSRENGQYYDRMWQAAIGAKADIVSVTSYNEWGEGTQIEPASSKQGYESYESYSEGNAASSPHQSHLYVNATQRWARRLAQGTAAAKEL